MSWFVLTVRHRKASRAIYSSRGLSPIGDTPGSVYSALPASWFSRDQIMGSKRPVRSVYSLGESTSSSGLPLPAVDWPPSREHVPGHGKARRPDHASLGCCRGWTPPSGWGWSGWVISAIRSLHRSVTGCSQAASCPATLYLWWRIGSSVAEFAGRPVLPVRARRPSFWSRDRVFHITHSARQLPRHAWPTPPPCAGASLAGFRTWATGGKDLRRARA
jgi:hypothetical protein